MANPNLVGNLSSMTGRVLFSGQMASGDNAIYTVPTDNAIKISTGVVCNTSGAAVTVSISIVPSGGSVDGTHVIVSGFSLAAGDSLSLKDYLSDMYMGPGDFINVNASAGSAVNAVLSGVLIN